MWCDTSSVRHETANGALLCSLVQIVRVVIVRVIVDGVLGVMIVVLIGREEVLVNVVIYVAIFVVIFCNWRCTLYRIHASFVLVSIGCTIPTILFALVNFAGHSRSHWCFQFLMSVLDGLLEFLVHRVNEIDPSQFSCVIKMELLM